MQTQVNEILIDTFDRIGIEMPNNFNQISNYICEGLQKTENWNSTDVLFLFKRFIEGATKN